MSERIKKTVIIYVVTAAAAALYYFLYKRFGFGIPCLFNLITGLKCPGCGNTRAIDELLHLRFENALAHNYMMPAEVIFIVYIAARYTYKYIKTGTRSLDAGSEPVAAVFLALLLIWWVVRNIFGI